MPLLSSRARSLIIALGARSPLIGNNGARQ
jgi:hypothetical protein